LSGLWSLLRVLAKVHDPRARRGIRHRLVTVLALAVVTVLGGATNFREIADQGRDLPQEVLARLGARWDRRRRRHVAPSAATVRRAIIGIDAEHADRLLCGWLREAVGDRPGSEPTGVAIDGKTLRGTGVKLFAAVTHGGRSCSPSGRCPTPRPRPLRPPRCWTRSAT
jgi:hypothetical protein